ncbi:MAG: 3'-5' exonuclease [Bacteroidales bacterium]|nr:3'-5' exonuclease [Bacteroidales bacterium]
MLKDIAIENVLFLDIETAPAFPKYSKAEERLKKLWDKKSEQLKREPDDTPESLFPRAGIYAEFGKVICISAGLFKGREFRIKSFYGDDEYQLLVQFCKMLNSHYGGEKKMLCAHNGKEFDFPFLARRILIHGIPLPAILDVAGRKPWEVQFLDTMELWKFGDYKHYTSLELLAAIFGIPTPKDDISGSDIHRVYWEDHDLERIRTYCQKDVLTVARLFLKYQQQPVIEDDDVILVE